MFLSLILHLIISISLILIGLLVNKKYRRNGSGKYFLFFAIFSSIWSLLYISSYTTTYDKDILLYISRLCFSLTIPAFYSIIIFFHLFGKRNYVQSRKKVIIISSIFLFIIGFSLFSPYVIEGMILDEIKGVYYEKFGKLYIIYLLLYIFVLPIFLIIAWFKLKTLNTINKIRFKIMGLGFIFLMSMSLLFLIALPAFGIFLLQKEIIIFFIPFLLITRYSIYRYYFMDMKIGLSIIFTFLLSLFLSIISTFSISKLFSYHISNIGNFLLTIWGQSNGISNIDLIIYLLINIILFKIIYFVIKKKMIGISGNRKFRDGLSQLKKEIPFITNLIDLNSFLEKKFKYMYKINYVEIIIFNKKNQGIEFKKYFKKNVINSIFLNDIIFIEENKNKFNIDKIKKEINRKSYLILPIYNNKLELIGIFNLGQNSFNDIFCSQEITVLKDFVDFILGHLKYLRMYDKINSINLYLDKKIDKETMKFNALINKQKDFISLISHEIKGPIGSAIFQVDCIIDDVNDGEYSKDYIKNELTILNNQLLKSGDLANKLFSIRQYDINKIELLKEKIKLNDLLLTETELFKKNHKNITFYVNLDENIGFMELDKVQFIQVFENLLNNAIKFSSKNNKNPKMRITNYIKDNNILIEIEDNGSEFKNINLQNIFEKYNTGEGSSIGLGMGLYLCKKIIELHGGKIDAKNSTKLGGARFIITLPN